MINYKIEIGGDDYTESCALPFKEQYVLDSALDNGTLTIWNIKRKEKFKPYTKVVITRANEQPYTFDVFTDKVTEIVSMGLYNHEIVLIEETKELEKKVVDTNTTTQPLVNDYFEGQSQVMPNIITSSGLFTIHTPNTYVNPLKVGDQITFISVSDILGGSSFPTDNLTVTFNGVQVYSGNGSYTTTVEEGLYILSYYRTMDEFTYSMHGLTETKTKPKKSITDVVNRLLAITETLKVGETPKLKFNQEQADFYDQRDNDGEPLYPAPEFSMTKSTLRECLDQVGGYIHSIVRLEGDTIYFDKLGGTKTYQSDFTYYINATPNINLDLIVDIPFIANNTRYDNIATKKLIDNIWYYGVLCYDGEEVYSDIAEMWKPNGEYRTITFLEKPTGDLLTWLENNATVVDETNPTLDEEYIGNYETLDAEQYATQLDSVVSNLVNIDDSSQGTITEPFANGYETVRASGTIRIGDGDNATSIIETEYPIEKIEKLIVGTIDVNGTDVYVGDITSYVYENAEYQALSGVDATYPLAKAYALTYTQGQRNISGLTFKQPDAISDILQHQAIVNILEAKTGQTLQSIFTIQKLTEIPFQLIYYPSVTARVKQSKDNLNEYEQELTSIYNQGANKVDSRAYGENLKGAIARLGNVEKFITFVVKPPKTLCEVGNYVIIDNEQYYIATMNVENLPYYIKVTAGLSKDFNALSKYIGIKNNIRMYEISEKQSVERFVAYDDYCVIGDRVNIGNTSQASLSYSGINYQVGIFTNSIGTHNPVTLVKAKGYDDENNAKTEVLLPVFSLGLGNSVWLGFRYNDNYSAGNTSDNPPTLNSGYYRIQDYVPYADNFGELETLHFEMYEKVQDETPSDQITYGQALPRATGYTPDSSTLRVGQDIILKKDSRENINFGYQLHFVTNQSGMIIGSELAQAHPLVSSRESSASLYILPNRINKFANDIDLTGATLVKNYNGNTTDIVGHDYYITIANETANADGKSWAMVDNTTHKLLFGKNITIENGDTLEMPTMSFTHKII